MKILCILVLTLIAGVMDSTVAQGFMQGFPPGQGGLSPMISGLGPVSDDQVQTLLKFLGDQCNKNGGDTVVDELKQSTKGFIECVKPTIEAVQSKVSTLRGANPQAGAEIIFKELCPRIPALENCVKSVIKPLNNCLDSKYQKLVNFLYNSVDSTFEFFCADLGRNFETLMTESATKCLRSNSEALQQCDYLIFADRFNLTVSPELWNFRSHQSSKNCSDGINKSQTCIVKELERCEDKAPSVVINSFFNFIKTKKPCENWINLSSSSARVADVLSITALMAISLRFV